MELYKLLITPVLASIFGGTACGIIGVWVILLRIPFIGIAMSHSAFAGAIIGLILHINPMITALSFATITSMLVGPLTEKSKFDPNISVGIIFSMVLGLAFVGLGLIKGPKTQALNLIWGSILLITKKDVMFLFISFIFVLVFLFLFYKEIKSILFHRELAKASGIIEKQIFYSILFLSGVTITFNLNTIGGLLIFSLIINCPSAAYQLTYRLKLIYILSVIFSVGSCITGLFLSYLFNLPVGGTIIVVSGIIFILSFLLSPKKDISLM